VLEWITAIVTPATVFSGLAFWFGWTLTRARSDYFGIDVSALGYTATDYVVRSADAIIVPVVVILLVVLAALAAHAGVSHLIVSGRVDLLRPAAATTAIVSAVLTLAGVWAVFAPLPVSVSYLFPPTALGLGVVGASYAAWVLGGIRHRRGPARARQAMPERVAVVTIALLAVVSLFWATSLYAAALGRGRAQELEAALASRPAVTVYAAESLALGEPVRRETIEDPAATYRFRYTGLRLLVHSAGKTFLLSEGWTRQSGFAVVLPDDPRIRFEYEPPR
jgi:hypothetical protein